MGYELDLNGTDGGAAGGWLAQSLAARWQRADARLAAALRDYALVRRSSAPDDPERIAAQLRVAQARLRWRECAEAAESLGSFPLGLALQG
jgi:hypothetical protein